MWQQIKGDYQSSTLEQGRLCLFGGTNPLKRKFLPQELQSPDEAVSSESAGIYVPRTSAPWKPSHITEQEEVLSLSQVIFVRSLLYLFPIFFFFSWICFSYNMKCLLLYLKEKQYLHYYRAVHNVRNPLTADIIFFYFLEFTWLYIYDLCCL